jgi:hypothetical protein
VASLTEKLRAIMLWHGHPGDILNRRIRVRDENREKLSGELVAMGVPVEKNGRRLLYAYATRYSHFSSPSSPPLHNA